MPQKGRTGATEGFYRRAWNAAEPTTSSSPPRRTFFGSVQHDNSADPAVKLGSLKPPGELGHQVIHSPESFDRQLQQSSSQQPQVRAHPQTIRARQRCAQAIRRSTDPSVTVAAVDAIRDLAAAEPQEPSLLASFSYRGMEVIFATSSQPTCYGMCARTRLVFQTLDLPSKEKIISIRANPATGQVVIAQADGSIQSYTPEPTDPKLVSFGRFRWWNGPKVTFADTFYSSHETPVISNQAGSAPGEGLDVSLADDYKVLVAHRDQLAVFDANPAFATAGNSKETGAAELLWTMRLPGAVVTAKLSGDGQVIALVLSRSETAEDDAEADGVHTFERDLEDGSQFEQQAPMMERPSLERGASSSIGLVYKPGPFLVHSTPVTRLSFRGFGHVASCIHQAESEQGNDLLLTYCASNCSARIFGQNNWKPLTEWKTPPSTRVDWVKGIAAFTLGDLESQKKPTQSDSRPPSRKPSSASLSDDDESLALNETLGKRNRFHTIPNHSAPSSNAGAWITEVTFQGAFPAFRLSRLTYLKRGVDDLNPTLFETVAAFLPAGSILEDCILQSDSEGLSIEGIWPAWNPWLSQTDADVNANETLRGSAMAFLGLASAPGATAGGFFGDNLLGTTQSPPAEIRMVASHPLTGKVVVLEIPLFGDRHLSSLELGSPIRSVLSLSDLDAQPVSDARYPVLAKRISASMDYESSRLVANIVNNSKAVSLTWRRPGTASLLPIDWLPEDVDPHHATQLLSESTRFQDESLLPVPLALPQVSIPEHIEGVGRDDSVHAVLWWPDESFGDTPLLLTVLSSGTILVFELPPPWSALEPKLPESLESAPIMMNRNSSAQDSSDDDSLDVDGDYTGLTENYTIAISPDPEYGLGLRLESQSDGMPAVAGSFKKHPLSGESLPAENSGMICLGDELVSANDVNLEEKSFDDIIAAVRELGANCGPGNPMRMCFRRMTRMLSRANSTASDVSGPAYLQSPGRRTMEEMLGINPTRRRKKSPEDRAEHGSSQKLQDNEGPAEETSHAGGNQQVISSVVGVFPSAVSSLVASRGSDETRPLLSLVPYTNLADESRKAALLFSCEGSRIYVRLMVLSTASRPEKAKMTELGSFDLLEDGSTSSPKAVVRVMEIVESEAENLCLAVCDSIGDVRLVFVSLEAQKESSAPAASFRQFRIFRVDDPCPADLLLRSCSIETLATMRPDSDGKCQKITVWTGRPHPGCHLGKEPLPSEPGEKNFCDYSAIDVRIESNFDGKTSKENQFVDFSFLRSGFLDASPSLVAFSVQGAVVYQKLGGKADWIPITKLSYCGIPRSYPSKRAGPLRPDNRWFGRDRNPRDAFPHLVPTLQSVFPALDEKGYLRADWHPDSLLALICADPRGARFALRKHVRELYIWLCSEGKDISEDHMQGPLIVAPFSFGENGMEDEELDEEPPKNAESIMASLLSDGAPSSPAGALDNDELLGNLQSLLLKQLSAREVGVRRRVPGFHLEAEAESTDTEDITPLLRSMSQEDLILLWGLGELVLESPDFKSLDVCGQLFSFSAALFRRIKNVPKSNDTHGKPTTIAMPTMHQRSTSSSSKAGQEDPSTIPTVATAGCLAALLSNSQSRLLERCRQLGEKITWPFARELKIPFWVRSDSALARLSEEIGQNIYREKKDIMECALFFIIAKKMRTLRNLAAADSSVSGRTFFKFLSSHDFSSERGRRAAEKNAFSLLRKCRYDVASAFFLLAEPPALKPALETIVTKMKDINLAFLVARLMESDLPGAGGSLGVGGASGGFGGFLGGGGGYAAGGASQPSVTIEDEKDFKQWKPCIGKATRTLLVERGLPLSARDNTMTAVQLLWLEKKEEASWSLSGCLKVTYGKKTVYEVVDDASQRGFTAVSGTASKPEAIRQPSLAIAKANALIDFMSAPLLLRSMNASVRARFAASLTVSSGLSARGLEGASIRSIIEYTDTLDLEEKENVAEDTRAQAVNGQASETTASSIFSAFDSPPLPKPVNGPSSSIFDSFDAPPPTASSGQNKTAQSSSSIFSDFDPPPQSVPARGATQSSIFDSFDVAPSPQVSQIRPQSSGMQSSIFDSFDAAPETRTAIAPSPKQVSQISPQSSGMQSSIFDSFDAAPQTRTPIAPSPQASQMRPQSSGMQSSIFDSFDAAPQTRTPKIPASIQDPLSSSIFDSFGPPPSRTGPISSPVDPAPPRVLSKAGSENGSTVSEAEDLITIQNMPTPALWMEWREEVVLLAAARRLLREVASVLALIHGDPSDPSIQDFYRRRDPLVPSGASAVLQLHCDAEGIMLRVQDSLAEVCAASNLNQTRVLNTALRLLGPSSQHHRVLFAAVLCSAAGYGHKTEKMVRAAAAALISRCSDFAFSCDDLVHQRKTRFHASSQVIRREAARVSWQLEICLWMHRGGGLPLSGTALKEAIIAVRLGLLVASWNQNFVCLEALIRSAPDCLTDEEAGRPLWTSLKILPWLERKAGKARKTKTNSGGWEFLVDCRRSQATEMLRERTTGCFIIRPHSQDHVVFTLSFKTNLLPDRVEETADATQDDSGDEVSDPDGKTRPPQPPVQKVRKDDVVQHAIIRLSDSGFRCGSFGPFTSLMDLLEAVSASLPFKLRFDKPPPNRVIKEEGVQPSPNAVFLRKLALTRFDSLVSNPPMYDGGTQNSNAEMLPQKMGHGMSRDDEVGSFECKQSIGVFLELLVLSLIRKQLSGVAAVEYDDSPEIVEQDGGISGSTAKASADDSAILRHPRRGSDQLGGASRILGPLLTWCRSMENLAVVELSPDLKFLSEAKAAVDLSESPEAIEVAAHDGVSSIDGGDAVLRRMIQRGSGVNFSTLRLNDGGESTLVVLFSRSDAVQWLLSSGSEQSEADAISRLERMESKRVIEPIDLSRLPLKKGTGQLEQKGPRYRLVDPWEVEALNDREGETRSATLGRSSFLGFGLGKASASSESVLRSMGGVPLLELWTASKGGVALTKALASVHPPWERSAGGDLQVTDGVVTEPPPFANSIRQHLYRNALFRRLDMPQRFLALVQVELLDLKNLTSPGGSLSLSVYALLRLKRSGSGSGLTNKARTLDSKTTHPVKLGKTSGPNAPASWGSVVRFRFPLPEDVAIDGTSYDGDREIIFKGPPCVLQVSVYEKKLLVDHALGTADIRTDGLWAGDQLEEWVPLRSEKHGINWFARIRLTLRFELMCLSPDDPSREAPPSAGMQKIEELSRAGGSAHEDSHKRSLSSPDLLSYFESMVYQ